MYLYVYGCLHNSQWKGVWKCYVKATLACTHYITIDFRNMWFVSCQAQTCGFVLFLGTFVGKKKPCVQTEKTISCGQDTWCNRFMLSLLNFRFSVLLWPLAMLKWVRMNLWRMSILLSISWSPFWRRTGRMCEHSISRVQWENLSVCIRVLLCSVNKDAVKCRIVHHTWLASSLKLLHLFNLGCVPLGWLDEDRVQWSKIGLDHEWILGLNMLGRKAAESLGASKEPVNPCTECIRQFLWCTIIQTDLGSLILIQINQRNILLVI